MYKYNLEVFIYTELDFGVVALDNWSYHHTLADPILSVTATNEILEDRFDGL